MKDPQSNKNFSIGRKFIVIVKTSLRKTDTIAIMVKILHLRRF